MSWVNARRFYKTTGIAGILVLSLVLFSKQEIFAQSRISLSGTVRDGSTNEPLIGVSILENVAGTPRAIGVTDNSGNFQVSVTPGANLVLRYVGYSDYTYKVVAGRNKINVRLNTTENKLKEALIIGYQTKTRELNTGSAVKIEGKELQDVPVSSVEQLLQGRVAGLNIQNNTGVPGGRGVVVLRGLSNISVQGSGSDAFLTPTSPLYVIDGVPVDADADFSYGFESAGPGVSPLSMIPPEDIESMEILKDAQATALYGSRGAYGVILITTRRGTSPIPLVRYTANFFVNSPPKLRSTIGGALERRIRVQEVLKYGTYEDIFAMSLSPLLADSLNPYYDNSTNWQDIFYRPTYNQTHNINISGGNPTFNYKTDLGYYHENGVIENTGFDRYSLSANSQYQPNPKFRVFSQLSTQLAKRQLGSGTGLLQQGVGKNGQASSLLPPPSYFQRSSLSALQTDNDNKTLNVRASTDINYQLLEGLNLSTSLSYEYASNTQDRFIPAAAHNDFSQTYAYDDRKFTLYNRNTVSYFRSVKEDHNFLFTVFNELYNRGYQAHVIQDEKTPNDQYQGPLGYDAYYSLGGGLLDNYNRIHTASFAGMFSYNYKQKYVLDLTYRIDGSSSSGFKDPYSKNPSIGLRWNFNKEYFLEDSRWLSYGSLRASWGQNIVPSGDIFMVYGSYVPRNTYNGNPRVGSDFDAAPNPYLKPATTTQYDLGFEAGLFDNHIEILFDGYYKDARNQLREKDLSNMTGYNKVNTNETSLVVIGYEWTLTFRPLPKTSAWNWTLSLVGTYSKDILTHLPDDARQIIQRDDVTGQHILFRVGRNALTNYLVNTLGVFPSTANVPVDPATGLRYRTTNGTYFQGGDPYYQDVDHNFILDDHDFIPAGNSQPLIFGGVQSYLTYKSFSLNINASYTAIRDILNNSLAQRLAYLSDPYGTATNDGPRTIVNVNDINYWSQAGMDTKFPNLFDYRRSGSVSPFRVDQTLFQEDGSYFKINTVTLAYLLNKEFTSRFGINTVRLYLSCNNLATFSGYSGPNPENVSSLGRDQPDGYPIPRTYNFGFNVEF